MKRMHRWGNSRKVAMINAILWRLILLQKQFTFSSFEIACHCFCFLQKATILIRKLTNAILFWTRGVSSINFIILRRKRLSVWQVIDNFNYLLICKFQVWLIILPSFQYNIRNIHLILFILQLFYEKRIFFEKICCFNKKKSLRGEFECADWAGDKKKEFYYLFHVLIQRA